MPQNMLPDLDDNISKMLHDMNDMNDFAQRKKKAVRHAYIAKHENAGTTRKIVTKHEKFFVS